jgi:transposase-like protein
MKSPPFCPNVNCRNHHNPPKHRWFWKAGHYSSHFSGRVQRFLCLSCLHRFSSQTFSIDYYAKRKTDYHAIDRQLRSTGSIRDISRDLSVSPATVINRISRLARNALALHAHLKADAPYRENLVADGFESYCVSQYFPNNITLLAGKESQYLYFANYCTLRRKGRMTDGQKRVRSRLERRWKADPQAVRKAFDEVVTHIRCDQTFPVLFTDEKWEYRQSLRRVPITHIRISSQLPRTVSNDLFSVNYLDREIRKDCANHVRETVCFSRDVNNCMERLWVYFAYHNYRKRYRIGRGERRTHAQVAGIDGVAIRKALKSYYTRRSFLSRTDLTGSMRLLWLRKLETPLTGIPKHTPKYLAA